jgi:hypothetical protein
MNGFGCRIQQASESNARHGGKFGCTSRTQSRRIPQVYEHSQIFPAVSQATCQCENGLVNGKAEAPPVLSFGEVALFRGSSQRPPVSEDPKTDQVAQWRWRFFGSRGKKTTGGSDFLKHFSAERRLKRGKCVSAAAASSGFARCQDRAATW